MKRTKIVDIFNPELLDTDVCVKGWVRTRRGNKHVQFVALNDGSTIKNIQIVFDMSVFTDEQLKPITTGASLRVTGRLVASMGRVKPAKSKHRPSRSTARPTPPNIPSRKKAIRLNFCAK